MSNDVHTGNPECHGYTDLLQSVTDEDVDTYRKSVSDEFGVNTDVSFSRWPSDKINALHDALTSGNTHTAVQFVTAEKLREIQQGRIGCSVDYNEDGSIYYSV
jgi:hypothetical protein